MENDEWFRKAYWVRGWNIVIMTNERLIILDINLQTVKELSQFVQDFDEKIYSWNTITLAHKNSKQKGFLLASAIC